MSYEVRLRRAVQKQLDKLAKNDYGTLARAISTLAQEPRLRGAKKLADSGLWRIRIGNYRVVYHINDEERVVVVARVARRAEDTYRRL